MASASSNSGLRAPLSIPVCAATDAARNRLGSWISGAQVTGTNDWYFARLHQAYQIKNSGTLNLLIKVPALCRYVRLRCIIGGPAVRLNPSPIL